MLRTKLGRVGVMVAAPAMVLACTSALHAAYGTIGYDNGKSLVVDTFDNPASFGNNDVNGGPAGTNWYDGFNPPPPNVRLDYGSATAVANHSATWSPINSTDNSFGGAGSGSVKLAWTWNTTADGDGSAAWTMDILNTAQTFTSVSFDMMIDPSSTHGQYANPGFNDYGYFQVFAKDQTYNQREGAGGPDGASLGDTPGSDPTAGFADDGAAFPLSSYGAGVWERFTVNFAGQAKNIRGILFQSYSQGVSGPQAIYLDNITLNAVPEPASLGMLGLAGSSLLLRRRRQV